MGQDLFEGRHTGTHSGIGLCHAPMRSSTWTANGRLRKPLYRSEVNVPLNRINKCRSARDPDADRRGGQSSLALNIGTLAGEDDPIWSHSSVSIHRLQPVSDKHPSKRDNGQPLLAGLEELLRLAVIEVLDDPLAAAEFGVAVLAT